MTSSTSTSFLRFTSATPSCGHVLNLVISEKGSASDVSKPNVSGSDMPCSSLQFSSLILTTLVFYLIGASSLSWLPIPFSLDLQVYHFNSSLLSTLNVPTFSHFYPTHLMPNNVVEPCWSKIIYSWIDEPT